MTDLITSNYASQALSEINLTTGQTTFLPSAITAASVAIRRFCARDFTRTTYTEDYSPEQDGTIRLRQMPVNAVTRVMSNRTTVLSLACSSTSNQRAWVTFSTSGDWDSGLSYTGLILNSVASGTLTSTTLLFATYITIGTLQTAINAVSGWTATGSQYSSYATADILGADVALGAIAGSADLDIYIDDISGCRLNHDLGMLYVGQKGYAFGPKWGPDWMVFEDPGSPIPGRVRVTYDAGFATIPADVQSATAEAVKIMLERLKTDATIKSEKAGDYEYAAKDAVDSLPEAVMQNLSRYRITRA